VSDVIRTHQTSAKRRECSSRDSGLSAAHVTLTDCCQCAWPIRPLFWSRDLSNCLISKLHSVSWSLYYRSPFFCFLSREQRCRGGWINHCQPYVDGDSCPYCL